jgi:hypothetical protein
MNQVKLSRERKEGVFYEVRLAMKGVKKRCRKTDFHTVTLGYTPLVVYPSEELTEVKNLAIKAIDKLMRSIVSAQIKFEKIESKKHDCGAWTDTRQLFDSANYNLTLEV